MATVASPAPGATFLKPKYLLFGFIGLMVAYVLVHNEAFLLQPGNPVWQHYKPFQGYLLVHGLAGCCVIFLGPLQFSTRFRRRFTAWHRMSGRLYIAAAMLLAPMGVWIQYFEERFGETRSFTIATIVDAILLMTTTGIAFAFILKGKVLQHREWMTRSYAVALVFVEVRVVAGITGLDQNPANMEMIVWACVGMSMLIGDLAWQAQNLKRPPSGR